MAADLSSAKAKLARADQHIQAAKQMMESYIHSDFYKLAARRQEQRKDRWYVVIKELKPIPPEIGLLIGDAAHNLPFVPM